MKKPHFDKKRKLHAHRNQFKGKPVIDYTSEFDKQKLEAQSGDVEELFKLIQAVRYDRTNRSSILDLDKMRIVTPTGGRVPLTEIANYKIERGDVLINHLDGRREIRVEADLSDAKDSAPEIIASIKSSVIPGNYSMESS